MREHHPDRIASEAEIQAALKQLNNDQRKRLKQHLGTPPKFENVPNSFWQQVEAEQAAVLLLLIASISNRSARHVRSRFQETGLNVSDSLIERKVSEYAVDRSAQVAHGVTETVKNRLKKYFEREQADQISDDDLSEILGNDQVETVAQTETTAANTQGEKIIRDDAKKQDMVVEVIWRTEDDSRVCPICRPLDDKPEHVWSRLIPLGPPAHPRCRCDLEIIIDGVSAGSFLPDIGIIPADR